MTTALRHWIFRLLLLGFTTALAQAQTTYRAIPMDCGGWFSGFAIHSSGRLYGFGDVFGMWRSDNAGQSWQYLQGDFTTFDTFVNGAAVAAGNADTVAFLSGVSPTNGKLFKSIDGGATWSNPLSGLALRRDRGATPLFFHPASDNEIWLASARAGLTGKLWRTIDGGVNWSKMGGTTFDTVTPTTIYAHPSYPDQIFVGGIDTTAALSGLYVSTDRGATFTLVWNNGGQNNPAYPTNPPLVTSIVRRSDGIGYFAANIGGFRLTASNYASAATYTATATVSRVNGAGPVNCAVLPNGDFITGDNGQYLKKSTDGGLNWSTINTTLSTPPTPAWTTPTALSAPAPGRDHIVIDPTNSSRWFMTGGKSPVISLDSGATWNYPPILNGLAGVPTYKTRFPRGAPDMALIPCSDQGLFTVTDGGLSGNVATSPRASIDEHFTFHEVLTSDDGQTLIAAGVQQGINRTAILRSTNGGTSWSQLDLTNAGLPVSYEGITRAVAAPGSTTDFLVLLGYTDKSGEPNNPGLYRTTNGGTSFNKVTGIPDGVSTGERYHHENSWLETDGINTNTRYLSLRSSNVLSARGFWRSTDGGSTWAMTPSQPYGAQSYIDCMAVDRSVAGRVWISNGGAGLRRSDNGGDSWNSVGSFIGALRIDAAYGRVAVWGRLAGDTWNKLYYSPDNGVSWSEKTGTGQRFANLSDLAVDPNRAGQIWVSGISINLVNPPSAPSAPPPALPTNFAATLAGLQANLSWTDNANDESGYAIEVRVGSATTFTLLDTTAANATTYSHTGLLDSVTYAYRIRALKAADGVNSAYTAIVSVTPPASTLPLAPSALATNALSASQILISWADNAYNETGTQVERSTAPDSGFTLLTTTAANTSSYTNTGLGEGVRYYYRVRSANGLGNSAYTAAVSGVTSINPPTNLITTSTSDLAIGLAWADNTTVETAYSIERSTSSGHSFTQIATTAANATSYTDNTVATGITYYYRVSALNAVATSGYTEEITVLASNYQPPALHEPFNYSLSPASVVGRTYTGTGANGNWALPEGSTTIQDTLLAGSLVAGRITGTGNQIRLPNTPSIGFLDLDLAETTLALIHPPASGSRTFWVSLIARSPNTLTTRPTAFNFSTQTGSSPISLGLYSDNNARYSLNFGNGAATTSSNNAIVANTTYLYIAKITASDTDGDATNGFEKLEGRLWQYPAASLPPLTEPTTGGLYRSPKTVASTRISNIELYSGCTSASDSKFTFDDLRIGSTYAQVALPPPPTGPSGLSASVTATTVTLTWTDNATDETAYRVLRATSPSGPFTEIASLAANTTSHTDTGLTPGTTYYYRVVASNSSGNSSAASTTATPVAPVVPTITASQSTTGVTGTALTYTIQTTGTPISYAHVSGTLPPGITLNTSTGLLSGTPTQAGTFTPGFTATNAGGTSPTVVVTLTIITPPPGIDYSFNTSQANFENTFNETTGWGPLWNAAAGLGGTGGLATDSTDRASLLPTSLITFTTAGQAVDLSIAFKARVTSGTTNTAGGEGLSLGLNRIDTPLLVSGGYLVASIGEASTNSLTSALASNSRNNASGTTVATTDTAALTLVDNDWYALDATVTYNGSNNFTVVMNLYGLGASGTATPVLLDTYTISHTALDSLVNTPLYAGFQGRSAGGVGGVRAFDDFYAGLPSALATFRTTHGLAADGSQDLLKPAADGMANLLKYAFNMIGSGTGQASTLATPNAAILTASGSAGLPLVGVDGSGKLTLTYIRRKAASSPSPGITYAVEFSDALATWAVNPSATESVTSLDATLERVTVTDSVVGPAKRFTRVKVTTP